MTTLESVITGAAPLSRFAYRLNLRHAQRPWGSRRSSRHSAHQVFSAFTIEANNDPRRGDPVLVAKRALPA